MNVGDKLMGVYESDQSFEEFLHELFDPVVKGGFWELDENVIDKEYDEYMETAGRAYQLEYDVRAGLASETEIENWPEEDRVRTEYYFRQGSMLMRWEWNSANQLISSSITYMPPRHLDGEHVAEPGTLLYELRNACERITKQHDPEYVERIEGLNQLPAVSQVIYKIHVPPDYDQALYQETVESVTAAAKKIDEMHQGLIEYVSNYG